MKFEKTNKPASFSFGISIPGTDVYYTTAKLAFNMKTKKKELALYNGNTQVATFEPYGGSPDTWRVLPVDENMGSGMIMYQTANGPEYIKAGSGLPIADAKIKKFFDRMIADYNEKIRAQALGHNFAFGGESRH